MLNSTQSLWKFETTTHLPPPRTLVEIILLGMKGSIFQFQTNLFIPN